MTEGKIGLEKHNSSPFDQRCFYFEISNRMSCPASFNYLDRCRAQHAVNLIHSGGSYASRSHARQVLPSSHVNRPRDVGNDALGGAASRACLGSLCQIEHIDRSHVRRGKFTSSDLRREAHYCTAGFPADGKRLCIFSDSEGCGRGCANIDTIAAVIAGFTSCLVE